MLRFIVPYFMYRIAERHEKRAISPKIKTLRTEARQPFVQRKKQAQARLVSILEYAGRHVPYYRDLFTKLKFCPADVAKDIHYLEDLPYLTKDIIQEQGGRMLSEIRPYKRLHERKTGSSTGPSTVIWYNQDGLDWTAAQNIVVLEWAGKKRWHKEAHLSTRFLQPLSKKAVRHEWFKCLALNRKNIFTDNFGDTSLKKLLQDIRSAKVRLVQGHPSTLYALARYVERTEGGQINLFSSFISTGETLEDFQRRKIENVLGCKVSNRYGAAEFGVMAQELATSESHELLVSDSIVWPELYAPDAEGVGEFVFSSLRNDAMPLIRYRMGDKGTLQERNDGWWIPHIKGRVHDVIKIQNTAYPTHFIQDILDRCGPILDFQVTALNGFAQELRLVTAPEHWENIKTKVAENFPDIPLRRIQPEELQFAGRRGKFRYILDIGNSA